MDDENLGVWVEREIDILRRRGLEGITLKVELRRIFWSQRRDYLSGLLKDARGMEEAWRMGADFLEQELNALMLTMSDLVGSADELG